MGHMKTSSRHADERQRPNAACWCLYQSWQTNERAIGHMNQSVRQQWNAATHERAIGHMYMSWQTNERAIGHMTQPVRQQWNAATNERAIKLQVSFAEYRLLHRALLQKRPVI